MRCYVGMLIGCLVFQFGCGGRPVAADSNHPSDGNVSSNADPSPSATPSTEPRPSTVLNPSFKPCNEYYPLVPGSQAKYRVRKSTGATSNVSVTVDVTDHNGTTIFKEVTRKVEGEKEKEKVETTTRRFVCSGGKIALISSAIDNRVGLIAAAHLESSFPSTAIVMPASSSLKPGVSWSYSMAVKVTMAGQSEVSRQAVQMSFETQGVEEVSVPAGTFKALRISAKVNGHPVDEYYARGIGLIKRSLGEGTSWELNEYSGFGG
jgi:hypothetical protein